MYIGGARLDAVYPLSTIADGQGLNITVMGSFDALTIGILADPEQVPDVQALIDGIVDELDVLDVAVGSARSGRQMRRGPSRPEPSLTAVSSTAGGMPPDRARRVSGGRRRPRQ